MDYFLDTEFDENGETIMPISLGLVREDRSYLYLELPFDQARAEKNLFVAEHVLPHLQIGHGRTHLFVKDASGSRWAEPAIAPQVIRDFVGDDEAPRFWAYYADYDWVLFCRIFGKMMDLPSRFPKLCMDLQQWYLQLGSPEGTRPPQPSNAHNALADAFWNLDFHTNLARVASPNTGLGSAATPSSGSGSQGQGPSPASAQ